MTFSWVSHSTTWSIVPCPRCPTYVEVVYEDDGLADALAEVAAECRYAETDWHAGEPPRFPAVEHSCRVYWGSHGCHLERRHKGHHHCDCCDCDDHPDEDSGCVATYPYYGRRTCFYGEDAPWWHTHVKRPWLRWWHR